MKYNKLGDSDIMVSAIGLGCMSLAVDNPKEVEDVIRIAYEQGVNFIDTADLYDSGLNETVIGQALKSYRKDIVLATKVGNKWRADGSGWDWDVSKAYMEQAVDNSLRRLQTDYIDLYQVHGGTSMDDFESVVDTMDRLIQKGKIRQYGISSIRPNVFLKYLKSSDIVSNMMQYSILDNRPEEYMDAFSENEVSLIARGVLAKGFLINKVAKPYLTYSQYEVAAIQSGIKELARELSVQETAIALDYVLKKPVVASALVGVRTREQLKDVLDSYRTMEGLLVAYDRLPIKSNFYKEHLV